MKRVDDFESRREHLKNLSDEELKNRFWELAWQITGPLIELAREYTSPSIERSVLLRMGFSSLEAKAIVDKCIENGLLGKGAGHVVLRYAKQTGMTPKEAGRALAGGDGWDRVREEWDRFGGGPDD